MNFAARSGALLVALAASAPALAKSDTQYWQTLQASAKVSDSVVVSDELVLRTSDARGFYEFENNVMLGYRLDKHVSVYAGWVVNPQYANGSHIVTEHRAREQIVFDNILKLGQVKVSGRLRLEERWRDGLTGTGWRLRPYVKVSIPVHGKTMLNLTHESFVDLGTTTFQKVGGEERMRNAILVNTPIARHVNLEIGYLEQDGFVPNAPDTHDHVVMTGLSAAF